LKAETVSGADPMVQVRALAAPNVEVFMNTAVREIRGDVLVREIVVEDQITGEGAMLPYRVCLWRLA